MNITMFERTLPSNPPPGRVILYSKADGKIYSKDHTGTEHVLVEWAAKLLRNSFPFFSE